MKKINKSAVFTAIFIILTVCAAFLRVLTRIGCNIPWLGLVRGVIYIALMSAWGISVGKRIIRRQVRQYLSAISALMVLWLVLRTVKFSFAESVDAQRHLWYFYYLPMLFIPLIALFVALLLGKSENYRLPRRTFLLCIPTALLLALVLTNDLHGLVFSFPTGVMSDSDYAYGVGYYIVVGWIILCVSAAFAIMLIRCKIPHGGSYLWLPLVPLALVFAYGCAYINGVYWVWLIAGDMTVTMCLFIVSIFECCICCGLIQSNKDYDRLFAASTIRAQITDKKLRVLHTSSDVLPLPNGSMERAVGGAVRLDEKTTLKCSAIRRGYVFWQEDISELTAVTRKLEMTREELWDMGDVLKEENEQKARQLRIEEKNRLFDLIEEQTSEQTALLSSLLQRLRSAEDIAEARHILGQVAVIGTYVKRRSNLVFLGSRKSTIPLCELRLCLGESAENLRLCGVECHTEINGDGELPSEKICRAYDLFEAVVETGFSSLSKLLFFAEECGGALFVNICAECDEKVEISDERFNGLIAERDDDGIFCFSMTV